VRDAEGQKMSKSKGNTIDPLDLDRRHRPRRAGEEAHRRAADPAGARKVEKRTRKEYPDGIAAVGTDALRFTFAALATYGRTINFDLKRCRRLRKAFCNKLWNAARFVLMNTEIGDAAPAGAEGRAPAPKTEAEKWILARLRATLAEVEAQMKLYRFDLVAQALYEFVWNEYCDWFVELAKPALGGEDRAAADSTRHTLLYVLEAALRALHPITPFITEEIFQELFVRSSVRAQNDPASLPGSSAKSILHTAYPRAEDFPADDATASADVEWLRAVLTQIRRIRSEMNIAPGKAIPLLYANGSAADRARAERFAAQIAFLARAESQRWLSPGEAEPAAATAVAGEMKLLIPLAGLIDVSAEKARLEKEIKRIEGELAKSSGKLANFGERTPAAVVEQERQRAADFTTTLATLREQAGKLERM
jgi:valyl-tRNA synthetase